MDFPTVHRTEPVHAEVLPLSHAMVPFILCKNQNHILLLTGWNAMSVTTPTSVQHRLARGTPADSLAAAHDNIQAAQTWSTRCDWSRCGRLKINKSSTIMSSGRCTIQSHLGEMDVNYCTYYLTNVHRSKWPFKADLSFLSWKYLCLSDFPIKSLNYSSLGQRFTIAQPSPESYHEHDRNTRCCFSPRNKWRYSLASCWQNDIQCTYSSRKRE